MPVGRDVEGIARVVGMLFDLGLDPGRAEERFFRAGGPAQDQKQRDLVRMNFLGLQFLERLTPGLIDVGEFGQDRIDGSMLSTRYNHQPSQSMA